MSEALQYLDGGEVGALALVEFFEQIAACPREGAGAWVFEHGATQLGVLLIEDGLICWSTLPGRSRRLLEILEGMSGSPRAAFADVIRACVAAKGSVAESLVQSGLISDEQLVRAFRRDTLESLLQIASTPERRGIWRPHKRRGYGASVRFSLTELLIEAASDMLGAERDRLTAKAEATFGPDAHYMFVSREGLPVAASPSASALSMADCLEMARHADDLAGTNASKIFVGATPRAPDTVTVVWREASYLGIIETRGPPHTVLRSLMARGSSSGESDQS